jgi:hypothetical protein
MPRYFFSTSHGDKRNDHEEALDLADDRAAWSEATAACGANVEWRMDMNDENHELVYSLRLIPEAYRLINRAG